jgi:hypothetical protein
MAFLVAPAGRTDPVLPNLFWGISGVAGVESGANFAAQKLQRACGDELRCHSGRVVGERCRRR